MANPTMESLIGATVYDIAGAAIGRVENFYLDNQTGAPTWVAMMDAQGDGPTLIPLDGAGYRTEDMSLRVPYAEEQIRTAPHLEHDGRIDPRAEQELIAYYSSGQRRGPGMGATNAAARQRIRPGSDEPMTYGAGREPGVTRSEERLVVDKDREETGTARLHKYVVEEEQTITVPTTHEEARLVREPITGRTEATSIGEQEQEVVLHADRVTAHKETVPVERVGLVVDEVAEEQSVSDTVRKERIEAEGVRAGDEDRIRDEKNDRA